MPDPFEILERARRDSSEGLTPGTTGGLGDPVDDSLALRVLERSRQDEEREDIGLEPAVERVPEAQVEVFAPVPLLERANWMLQASREVNVENAIRAKALSNRTGMPFDVVKDNLDEVEKDFANAQFDLESFRSEAPSWLEWAAENPENMAVIQANADRVSGFEAWKRSIHGDYTRGSLTYEMVQLLEKDFATNAPNILGLGPGGGLTDKERERLNSIRSTLEKLPKYNIPFVVDAVGEGVNQGISTIRPTLEGAAQWGALGATAGGLTAAALGVAAAPVIVGGAALGAKFGVAKTSYDINGLLAWDDCRQRGVDPETCTAVRFVAGGVNGALDAAGLLQLGKLVAPIGSRGFTKALVNSLRSNPATKKSVSRFSAAMTRALSSVKIPSSSSRVFGGIKNLAVATGVEAGTEVLQEYNEHMLLTLAEMERDGIIDFSRPQTIVENLDILSERGHTEELFAKMKEAATAAVQVVGLGGAGRAALSTPSIVRQAKAELWLAQKRKDAIVAANKAIEGSKELEQSRDAIEQVSDNIAPVGSTQYILKSEWERIWNETNPNIDPGDQFRSFSKDPDSYGSIDDDQHLAIPDGRFTALLSQYGDLHEKFAEVASPDPDTLSLKQATERVDELQSEVESAAEEAELQPVEGAEKLSPVEEVFFQADLESGFTPIAEHEILADGDENSLVELEQSLKEANEENVSQTSESLSRAVREELERRRISQQETQIRLEERLRADAQKTYQFMDRVALGQERRINRKQLLSFVDKDDLRKIPKAGRRTIYSNESGAMGVDEAAIRMGFETPQEMASALVGLAPKEQAVDTAVSDRMAGIGTVEMSVDDIKREIVKLKRGQKHLDYIHKQLTLLNRKLTKVKGRIESAGRIPPTTKQALDLAGEHIAGLTPRQGRESIFRRASIRSMRKAAEASSRGDFDTAFTMGQRAMMNMALSMKAAESLKILNKLKKLNNRVRRRRTTELLNRAPEGVKEHVEHILSKYSFSKGGQLTEIPEITVQELQSDLEVPIIIDPEVVRRSRREFVEDVPYHEIISAVEAVEQLLQTAKVAVEGTKLDNNLTADQKAAEMTQSIDEKNIRKQPGEIPNPTGLENTKPLLKGIVSFHLKAETLAEFWDGNEPFGPVWNYIIRPIQAAQNVRNNLQAEASSRLQALLDLYPEAERRAWFDREFHVEELGLNLSKAGLIAIALNSSSNMAVLTNNSRPNFTLQNISAVLANKKYFNETDAKFVQGVWDLLESYWEPSLALYKKLHGKSPKRAEFTEQVIGGFRVKGGYYPIAQDPNNDAATNVFGQIREEISRSAKFVSTREFQSTDALFGGAYGTHVMAQHSRMHERAASNRVRLDLKLAPLERHINEVIHDLAFRETVLNVKNLLQREDVSEAMIRAGGKVRYDEMMPWLRAVAQQKKGDHINIFEKVLSGWRVAATTYSLGYSLTVGMLQLADIPRAVGTLGSKWAMSGFNDVYISNSPWNAFKEISEKSSFMANRMDQGAGFRDIREVAERMSVPGLEFGPRAKLKSNPALQTFARNAHRLTATLDMAGALMVWQGAYNKALAGEVKNISTDSSTLEQDAIDFADRSVRTTFGSGLIQDLAAAQRGPELMRLFSMFMTFHNTLFQQYAITVEDFRRGNVSRALSRIMWWSLIPTALELMVRGKVSSDDEPEEALKVYLRDVAFSVPQSMFIIRDVTDIRFKLSEPGSPALDFANKAFKGAVVLADRGLGVVGVTDKDELTKRDESDVIAFFSLAAPGGLPGRQIEREWRGWLEFLGGDRQPNSVIGAISRLLDESDEFDFE